MKKSESISKLAMALSKAQAEMPVVRMNAQNPFLKNKYADLGAVIETSRPILAKYGLSVSQFPTSEADKIGVTSILIHESGEYIEDSIFIPASDSKGLSVAQSAGVVISYLRRYSWASMLGLYADEDTDGHAVKPQAKTEPVKAPALKDPERTELVKEFSASFNAIPASRKGEAKTITGKSTPDEIKQATEHNKSLVKENK